MMEEIAEFQVSVAEMEYLNRLISVDESLTHLPRAREGATGRGATIRLSHADAESLRGRLTEELAAMGFGEDYMPNEQGRMLEDLIDRFYIDEP